MVAQPERRFTVDEYERMIEAGILGPGERVELFEGRIIAMAPMGGPHIAAIVRINRMLVHRLPPEVDVLVQMPIRLRPDGEPEPDLAIVLHRDDDYATGAPESEDVLLVVEVADSSLAFHRDRKIPRYAAGGIPEAWLVDLPSERIWIYRSPQQGQYQLVTSAGRGETLSPLAFPALVLAVDDLLPPAAVV